MRFNQRPVLTENEVTEEALYRNRRRFLQQGSALILGSLPLLKARAQDCVNAPLQLPEDSPNSIEQISHFNNYYEFSTSKDVVYQLAQDLTVSPWSVRIEGECEQPQTLGIEDLLGLFDQEQRLYRLRCVEGWSMVIPWDGFSLCRLLDRVQPTSRAKFVEFVSLYRPEEMIGQRNSQLEWPYTEALRMDEAMHPLTMLVTGLYGQELPGSNGAPLRLAVPWKYGYKQPKAITKIILRETQPKTTWASTIPSEYGFYGNVNPEVAHPRWSQSRENRIGKMRKQRTEMFNGYAEQVASLYRGLDLSKHY